MTKDQIEKEMKVHEYKAAQHALTIVEAKKTLAEAEANLERETGAFMILKGLLTSWQDETTKTDKAK